LALIVSAASPLPAQSNCTFSVSPTQLAYEAEESQKGVLVTVTGGTAPCVWHGVSDAPWIHVSAQVLNANGGSIAFTAQRNNGPARTARLVVAGVSVTATQAAGAGATPGAQPPSITAAGILNAASYVGGGIAPGEIVTIYGDNLGPNQVVAQQIGADGTTLLTDTGRTRILFDGEPAVIVYTSKSAVSAVVPYSVSGKSVVGVRAEYEGRQSELVSMPVYVAIPGIFSLDASGKGPGAVLNQDGSVNGASRPAKPGETIQIYGTGAGDLSPAPREGQISPGTEPLPRVKLPVTVSLGDRVLQTAYAGVAPRLTQGLLQVNVALPADIATGNAVPVTLHIGGQTSPPVTIAIAR
jgi:uncharacterized protein (TIGR03437 family)